MGASTSVPTLDVVKTSCARIAQVQCQPGIHFQLSNRLTDTVFMAHDLVFQPNQIELPPSPDAKMAGVYNLSITKDFHGIKIDVAATAEQCAQFNSLIFAAAVPVTDSFTCTLNTSTSGDTVFGGKFMSTICTTGYNVTYQRSAKEFSIDGEVVLAPCDNIIFGIGGGYRPDTAQTSVSGGMLLTYKFLQTSWSHTRTLRAPGSITIAGVNLFLDRDVVLNACVTHDTSTPRTVAFLGAAAGIGKNGVNCGISTDGVITASLAREVADGLRITGTTGLHLIPMAAAVGIEINMVNI